MDDVEIRLTGVRGPSALLEVRAHASSPRLRLLPTWLSADYGVVIAGQDGSELVS